MKRIGWVLLAVWAVLSVAVLGRLLYDGAKDQTGEIKVRFTYEVLAVNFPISAALVYIAPSHPVWQWSLFTLGGFIQWILVAPALVKGGSRVVARLRGRRDDTLP